MKKVCGLINKINEIKNKFLEKEKGYRFGIVDDVAEFKFTSRSVGVVIEGEEFRNGQRFIDLNFYYSENQLTSDLLNFREKEENHQFDSFSSSTKIEYGNIEDETQRASLRTAVIKKTYNITKLLIDEIEYEKMSSNIYLEPLKEE